PCSEACLGRCVHARPAHGRQRRVVRGRACVPCHPSCYDQRNIVNTSLIGGVMLTALSEATRTGAGGKAAALGVLLRAGLPVPDGFVVPSGVQQTGTEVGPALRDAVASELERLGDPVVAVRSSAANEDSAEASAAGQYESTIGVHGADEVCQAVADVRASARSA